MAPLKTCDGARPTQVAELLVHERPATVALYSRSSSKNKLDNPYGAKALGSRGSPSSRTLPDAASASRVASRARPEANVGARFERGSAGRRRPHGQAVVRWPGRSGVASGYSWTTHRQPSRPLGGAELGPAPSDGLESHEVTIEVKAVFGGWTSSFLTT